MAVECFEYREDRGIAATELIGLLASVDWGEASDYDPTAVARSIAAHSYVAYCRDDDGLLVGYVSAFSDGIATIILNELAMHPDYWRRGIGSRLLACAIKHHAGIPIYAMPFRDNSEAFMLKRGFRFPRRSMSVVTMRNGIES